MLLRYGKLKDIPQLKKIWADIFNDSPEFINWFFESRFMADLCYVCEKDGEIISCLHGYPVTLNVRGVPVHAISVSGVATLPQFRGKGIMKKLLGEYLIKVKEKGYPLAVLTAVNPEIYKPLGFVHITDAFWANEFCGNKGEEKAEEINIKENIVPLKKCYEKYGEIYSGNIIRGDFFDVKMMEYASENCKCWASYENGEISAYVVYAEVDGKAVCGEMAGSATEDILGHIGIPFICKLPKDTITGKVIGETKEDAMGYITDINLFARVTGYKKNNLPEEGTSSAGKLLQTVMGYKIHPEFSSESDSETTCFYTDLY